MLCWRRLCREMRERGLTGDPVARVLRNPSGFRVTARDDLSGRPATRTQAAIERRRRQMDKAMNFYLPIAEMSVNVTIFLGMGAAVGFISGMFGVGGGFLMTPLLIFAGIPVAVAVGTESAQIVASSVSGAVAQWRRRNIDLTMAAVLLAGGMVGAALGVRVVGALQRIGQLELFVTLCYVTFLSAIGTLMLIESYNEIRRYERDKRVRLRSRAHHNWIHRLPFKIRFQRSKLYISAIPPLMIGAFVGFLGGIMGIGGGFIMVPAMIYLLRMPIGVVIGTSLLQIVFVTAFTTVLHARQNFAVDIVLALALMIGGVVGAQFGAAAGEKLRAEQLRFFLAILVIFVGLRMAWTLVAPPGEVFSITSGTWGHQ